jgi:hypothetical protein
LTTRGGSPTLQPRVEQDQRIIVAVPGWAFVVVPVAATPEGRVRAIAARLEQDVVRYERARDSRAVFAYGYSLLTRALASALSTDRFEDPDWVAMVAETFAERYFQASEAYDHGLAPPTPWLEVLDAICKQRSSALEDLVFPMTVHIVHDLPLTLVDLGLTAADGTSRVFDHHLVNDVLERTIDTIQESVARRYEPFVGWLDRLGADLDEIATNYGLRVSRGVAWYNANRLLDPASRGDALAAIKRSPLVLVEQVRRPPIWSLRLLFCLTRSIAARFRRWPRYPLR